MDALWPYIKMVTKIMLLAYIPGRIYRDGVRLTASYGVHTVGLGYYIMHVYNFISIRSTRVSLVAEKSSIPIN